MKKIKIAAIILSTVFFINFPELANAANFYFSPSQGSYAVGSFFTVSAFISSQDQAMNAAFGVISFPSNKVEVISLSKTGSIFGLWVQDPTFSNSSGIINFGGIVLNPGFIGAGGKIISINFKVKATGNIPLSFFSVSALANDGSGTDIFKSASNALFVASIDKAATRAPQTAPILAESIGLPQAPIIFSTSHPNPNSWYNKKRAVFSWGFPPGVTAIKLQYDKSPSSHPQVLYSPAILNKEISNIPDGIYYFHAQFQNANGWGEISHFRFQIDTVPPEPFEIEVSKEMALVGRRPTISFNTTDSLSGIDYYQIKIGEGDVSVVKNDEIAHNPYSLPPQTPGKRTVLVKAYDRASNYSVDTTDLYIESIESPTITSYTKELIPGENFIFKGATNPEYSLSVWVMKVDGEPKRYTVYPEKDGAFTFIYPEKTSSGTYNFWVVAANNDNLTSEPTEKSTFIVKSTVIEKIFVLVIRWMSIIVPLFGLIIIFALMLFYGWHRFKLLKDKLSKIRKETVEAEFILGKAFCSIKNDVDDYVKMLERTRAKRELTEEEEKIVKKFKKHFSNAEKLVKKEIKDIEEELTNQNK